MKNILMKYITIEIIFTYEGIEQQITTLTLPEYVNEKMMMKEIFGLLNKKELEKLIKLSICQLDCNSIGDCKEYLLKSNGKYYFSEEDKGWLRYKNNYIKNMKKEYKFKIE